MSLTLAMKTASVPAPSYRSGRRRPRVVTRVQRRTSYPACSNSSCDWPRTMRETAGISAGKRPAAYANAATSGVGDSAPSWSAEPLYECASSNARTRTSPVDRRSDWYVRM